MISWCSKNQMFQILTNQKSSILSHTFESWKHRHHKEFICPRRSFIFPTYPWSTAFEFVRDFWQFVCSSTDSSQVPFVNHESIQCEHCNVRVQHSKVFSRTLLTYWNLGWASSNNFKQAKINVILIIRH